MSQERYIVSDYYIPEVATQIRMKITAGEIVDIDELVPLARAHAPRRTNKELVQIILAMVTELEGNASWGETYSQPNAEQSF
jgi:hypothetical protein